MVSIALVGNPNVGKTTLFNALSGLRYKVANYPGVTVEKRSAEIELHDKNVFLIDLPGLYSLTASTCDEQIAVSTLLGSLRGESNVDVIINVIDSSHLERGLLLTAQLRRLPIPSLIVLTMSEEAERDGTRIHTEILSRLSGCGVLVISDDVKKTKQIILSEVSSLLSRSRTVKLQEEAEASICFEKTLDEDLLWASQTTPQVISYRDSLASRRQERINHWCTHPIVGYLILAALLFALFQSLFTLSAYPMEWIEEGVQSFGAFIASFLPSGPLQSLIVDGIISGVGSVIVFLPQIAILIFLLSLLEQSGYLSRAACLVDKPLQVCGLQGRSFIPLLSGFACAIPATLSTRSIPSWSDRLITLFVLPLVSCSARLPVYVLLISIAVPATTFFGFISLQALVMASLYLLGVLGALALAKTLRSTAYRDSTTFFALELPRLRVPSLSLAVREGWERVFLFTKDTGPTIFACTVVLWFLASFPFGADPQATLAASIGRFVQPLFAPLGYSWELTLALISSLAAREVFVSSLATLYNLSDASNVSQSLTSLLTQKMATGEFSRAVAYSLLVFYVWALMCVSTLTIAKRETGSWKYPFAMFFIMGAMAYGGAWITYQLFR
jgi:ferrous iron transport protein B